MVQGGLIILKCCYARLSIFYYYMSWKRWQFQVEELSVLVERNIWSNFKKLQQYTAQMVRG